MIQHYFTVAVRNIFKYKLQSFISLIGLAISFTCVSLAVYWNHYEVSFDSFHRNADRIFRVRNLREDVNQAYHLIHGDVVSVLKRDYPEIEKACAIVNPYLTVSDINGNIMFQRESESFCYVTPDLFEMFDFEWIEGRAENVSLDENKVAISEYVARKIGKTSPIGFKLQIEDKLYEVAGVYKVWSTHSNLKMDIINVLPEQDERILKGAEIYTMFKPNVDVVRFLKKIEKEKIAYWVGGDSQPLNLWTPLKALHYTYPKDELNMRIRDVYLFTGFAVLLSLCALLNYLTLFISRIRTRGRDMALRMMCGSSTIQLGVLLLTEYFLLLFGSLLVCMLLIELTIPSFMELSQIAVERSSVYWGCGYLLVFILILSLLLSLVPIFYFRREVLRTQIEVSPVRLGNNRFSLTAVCLQLTVSFFFMFCTTMMMKQIHHLLHTDIHVERKQIGVVHSIVGANHLMDILRQIPSVKKMVPVTHSLFPLVDPNSTTIMDWEGKSANASPIHALSILINDSIAQFYGIKIKEGTETFGVKQQDLFINETFAQKMGVFNPIGKQISPWGVIRGVVCDFQSQSPVSPIPPILFMPSILPLDFVTGVAFKYEGNFSDVEKTFREIFERKKDFTFYEERLRVFFESMENKYSLKDSEAEYRKLLEPEYNILKLMGIVFIVSLLIALFGIYALVVQACEKHRKEIAIRKVNGARVIDILSQFFSQYMQQVVVAAIIAFPIGYWVIKRWLEEYTIQTGINFWVFFVVFFTTTLLVTTCVGWHIWRAANENPAHVIRKG